MLQFSDRSELKDKSESHTNLFELLKGISPCIIWKIAGGHLNHGDTETPHVRFHVISLLIACRINSLRRHVGFAAGIYCFRERVDELTADSEITQLHLAYAPEYGGVNFVNTCVCEVLLLGIFDKLL